MLAIKTPQTLGFHQSGIRHDAGGIYFAAVTAYFNYYQCAGLWARVNPALESSLRASGVKWQTEIMTGYCTDERVAHYARRARKLGVQWIVGVGGGRVLDTAKAVADALEGGESVTLPTVASTCAALVAAVGVLYRRRWADPQPAVENIAATGAGGQRNYCTERRALFKSGHCGCAGEMVRIPSLFTTFAG